ncbi:MAG TPA: hypothetical protein VK661_05845 [Planctomycetota bacterium]|jgi:hypothetical protein|nr:hypothetical protein [Planctomycetota bacterium]
MSLPCPSCGAAIAASDPTCPSCGAERAVRKPVKASSADDVFQYVKIVGILVVVVVVVLIVAGTMGSGTAACAECKGAKIVKCQNCLDGRNLCHNCKGSGFDPQNFSTCPVCKGKGDTAVCWKCQGHREKPCPSCKGTGVRSE